MTDLNKDELLQELAYLEQAEYIDKQIYTKLVEIVEQHFSDPNKKSLGKLAEEYGVPYSLVHAIDARLAKDYESDKMLPDKDKWDSEPQAVDEEISKWIDENIRMNELTIVEDHICADEAQKEIDILRRIKQLLTQKRGDK